MKIGEINPLIMPKTIMDYLKAFELLMKRNKKLVDSRIKSFLNFINVLRNIVKGIRNDSVDAAFIQKLKDKIITCKPIACLDWLTEKVKELESQL